MKTIFLIFAFLLSAELCLASKDSAITHLSKFVMLQDTTERDINDGWDENTFSSEPLPQEKSEKTKKEKKAEKKQARKEERENHPSNFPRGVAWSSVALAAIGLFKIIVQNCK